MARIQKILVSGFLLVLGTAPMNSFFATGLLYKKKLRLGLLQPIGVN
jgi:hypothetical protein